MLKGLFVSSFKRSEHILFTILMFQFIHQCSEGIYILPVPIQCFFCVSLLLLLLSLQSCLTLCDPIDGSPPGSSVHGIFQARVLEWVAIAFSVVSLCSCKPHSSFTPISQVNSSIFSFYAFISAVDTLVIIHSFLKLIFIVFSFC